MIEAILLDIDGVCNAFQHYVFNCLGLLYPDDSWYPVDCGWDIVAAANRIAGYERFTATSFWNSITREMWASVPPSSEFSEIIAWVRMVLAKGHTLPVKPNAQPGFSCREAGMDLAVCPSMDAASVFDRAV